jgi:hypothetical protein
MSFLLGLPPIPSSPYPARLRALPSQSIFVDNGNMPCDFSILRLKAAKSFLKSNFLLSAFVNLPSKKLFYLIVSHHSTESIYIFYCNRRICKKNVDIMY